MLEDSSHEETLRVLVVDDDPRQRQLCIELLDHWAGRCRVEASATPVEALARLGDSVFDVILSDQCMPGMTGTDMLSRARRLQPNARRVLMSAYADVTEVLPSIESGDVHRFVAKPIVPEELLGGLSLPAERPQRLSCLLVDRSEPRAAELVRQVAGLGLYDVERAASLGDQKPDLVLWIAPESTDEVEQGVAMMSVRAPETTLMVALAPEKVRESIGLAAVGVHEILWLPLRSDEVALRHELWRAKRSASREAARVSGQVAALGSSLPDIVGASDAMRQVFHRMHRVAASDASVMLIGETGTGKEMMARAIHALSPRRERPFLAVNLSALPESLVESELFGYEKGAFTGARASHAGRLEAVDGGTLFLDEIGDLGLNIQVKLLRVLEQRTFERLGDTTQRRADFRLICATHRDLAAQVADGSFREDLYYRLDVVRIDLPPLRDRREDIPALAQHFLDKCCRSYGLDNIAVSGAAMQSLLRHDWRGNVRELQHTIERAVALARSDSVIEEFQWSRTPRVCFRQHVDKALEQNRGLREVLADIERLMLVQALDACGGNQVAAARKLKIPRQTLQHRLKKHEL